VAVRLGLPGQPQEGCRGQLTQPQVGAGPQVRDERIRRPVLWIIRNHPLGL